MTIRINNQRKSLSIPLNWQITESLCSSTAQQLNVRAQSFLASPPQNSPCTEECLIVEKPFINPDLPWNLRVRYWTWPFIMSSPIKNVMFDRFLYVYQRVSGSSDFWFCWIPSISITKKKTLIRWTLKMAMPIGPVGLKFGRKKICWVVNFRNLLKQCQVESYLIVRPSLHSLLLSWFLWIWQIISPSNPQKHTLWWLNRAIEAMAQSK